MEMSIIVFSVANYLIPYLVFSRVKYKLILKVLNNYL